MTALFSAEVLRLRTLRSPRYIVLAVFAFAAFFAAMDMLNTKFGSGASPAAHADSLRAVALNGVLIAAVFAAGIAAAEFKRGAIALTYMAHPDRRLVTAGRALTWAAVGGLVAALAASVGVAVGLVAAEGSGVSVDIDGAGVARLIGGSLFAGAVFGSLGALVGTLTRNPTVAGFAIVAPSFIEGMLQLPAIRPYLPLGLVEQVIGLDDEVPAGLAMLLLLVYPALVAGVLRWWGLRRDIT
jgi:ABC-type transport system involved in multi-copper enzyme maturation permease subunit